ncbi:hypothetical protein SVAN01_03536 [Stagonosporopsis vannaccii]|nr:hypothetical protein SVAN01_03536 [Stagonosporopsis vannaccii]
MSSHKASEKPFLNEELLQSHGIYFYEEVHHPDELEDWLRPIIYQLTRERTQCSEKTISKCRKELKVFYEDGQDREEAMDCDWSLQPGESEDDMTHFAKTSRHENVLWNEVRQSNTLEPGSHPPTQPKPDLTYDFPIIDTGKELYSKYKGDRFVESFSWPILRELRNRENGRVISSPTTKLHKAGSKKHIKVGAKDLTCFPWAIVEVKHGTGIHITKEGHIKEEATGGTEHEKRRQYCYCQAANASTAGLVLRENLAKMAKEKSITNDALVMFSFTCVGPSVKLWITYRERPIQSVYQHVKPEISRWISFVPNNPPLLVATTPSGDKVAQRRRAASCEPLSEENDSQRWDPPTPRTQHTVCRAKVVPLLERGKTAPGSLDRQRARTNVPQIHVNICSESYLMEPDLGGDEGYSSVHESEPESESDEDERSKLRNFICDDELSEDEDSDASYVDTSPGQDDDDDDDDNEGGIGYGISGPNEDLEDYVLSDDEGRYYRSAQQHNTSSRLGVHYTPARSSRSSLMQSRQDQSPSQRNRRRSSRF